MLVLVVVVVVVVVVLDTKIYDKASRGSSSAPWVPLRPPRGPQKAPRELQV